MACNLHSKLTFDEHASLEVKNVGHHWKLEDVQEIKKGQLYIAMKATNKRDIPAYNLRVGYRHALWTKGTATASGWFVAAMIRAEKVGSLWYVDVYGVEEGTNKMSWVNGFQLASGERLAGAPEHKVCEAAMIGLDTTTLPAVVRPPTWCAKQVHPSSCFTFVEPLVIALRLLACAM